MGPPSLLNPAGGALRELRVPTCQQVRKTHALPWALSITS